MATYSFTPHSAPYQSVDWDDPTQWSTGTVPDSADADVIIPPVSTADYPFFIITIDGGRGITLESLTMSGSAIVTNSTQPPISLTVAGAMVISGEANIAINGTLSAGSLRNIGDPVEGIGVTGQLTVAGELYNTGLLRFGNATLTAGQLDNEGSIVVGVNATLTVDAADFVNFHDGTLTGGSYAVMAGFEQPGSVIDLKTGGVITTLASHLSYSEELLYPTGTATAGQINSYDPGTHSFVPVQSTLLAIASGGDLELSASSFTNTHSLTVGGTLSLDDGIFTAPVTTLASGGQIVAVGLQPGLEGLQLNDSGLIAVNPVSSENSLLTIDETVIGHGDLLVGAAVNTVSYDGGYTSTTTATLELKKGASTGITFADGSGTVILDTPQKISSVFHGTVEGDRIVLAGINLADVTGYHYAGCTTSGELTVQEAGQSIHLLFAGNYLTSSFALSAGEGGTGVVITDVA